MNSFFELIQQRKSTREYSPKPVPRRFIESCLEAARLAPSACNSQPWSFLVLDNPATIVKVAKKAFSGLYRMNAFVKRAPVLIVVITERSSYIARMGGMYRHVKYNLIDIGIAGDHLTLRAEELGLGTCWLGWFNEKAVKKLLGLPRSTRIDIIISIGYPKNGGEKKKTRKPINEIRRYLD